MGVKILKFFDEDPGSGMETVRIRDPGWKKVGSGIRDKHPGSATLAGRSSYILQCRLCFLTLTRRQKAKRPEMLVRCCQDELLYYTLSSLLRNLPGGRRQGRGPTRWYAAARMSSGGSQSGHSLTRHSPVICLGSENNKYFSWPLRQGTDAEYI